MTTSAARLGTWLYSQPYILLPTTAASWGGNIVLGRVAAGHIPPLALAQMRWIGAFVILALIFWPKVRQDLPVIRRHLPIVLLLSFVGITLYNSLAYVGLQYTPGRQWRADAVDPRRSGSRCGRSSSSATG